MANRAAMEAVARALKDGQLVRAIACEGCGFTGYRVAHHPDYSQPLIVEWLCSVCHKKRSHRAVNGETIRPRGPQITTSHISRRNSETALPRLIVVALLATKRLTFAEIGVKLGVSRQRAAQLVARARERGLIEDATLSTVEDAPRT